MTLFAVIAVAGLSVAAFATFARAFLQSPRLPLAPNAHTLECAAYDMLAALAALRAWAILEKQAVVGFSEAALSVALAATAVIGLGKVLFYARR